MRRQSPRRHRIASVVAASAIHGALLWLVPAELIRSLGDSNRDAVGSGTVPFATHRPMQVVSIERATSATSASQPSPEEPSEVASVSVSAPLTQPVEEADPVPESESPPASAAWERLQGAASSAPSASLSSAAESGGAGDVTRPVVIALPAARYPDAPRSGVVVVAVRVRVGIDGRVSDAEVVDDAVPDVFRAPALAVAARARFEPARRDGSARAAWTTIRVVFDPD